MAKVGFKPTNFEDKKHLSVRDCFIGDIIYIEGTQLFALILEQDFEYSKIAYLHDGDIGHCDNQAPCRKFVGKINFDENDFEEFL